MEFRYKIVDLLDKKVIEETKNFEKAKEVLTNYSEKIKTITGAKYERVIFYGILREAVYSN